MAKRAKPCQSATSAPDQPAAFYQLHALLGTVRQLARHEDDLCALLADIERRGRLTASTERELSTLLGNLPVDSLLQELAALWRTLERAA